MSVVVLKFGGSSLATPEQIKAVALRIADLHRKQKKIIVVTSAMGKTTDQLTELAHRVSARPLRREFDMLLTTGERVSMALLAIALNDIGCPAISFTGSQAGIMTDGQFCDAKITEIKPLRVESALNEERVVILAGFQGVDPVSKEITTLGRGGSDTTALAMAAHFKATRCEILKDVDGVFNADPSLIPTAQLIPQISIQALYEFCFWGAKVINYHAVDWAKKYQVPLSIGRSDSFKIGTTITYQNSKSNSVDALLGVNSHKLALEISVTGVDLKESLNTFQQIFAESDLAEPQILMTEHSSGVTKIVFATQEAQKGNTIDALTNSAKVKILRKDISTVTATYENSRSVTQIVPASERVACIKSFF